jgi:hypothetical protein
MEKYNVKLFSVTLYTRLPSFAAAATETVMNVIKKSPRAHINCLVQVRCTEPVGYSRRFEATPTDFAWCLTAANVG